MYNLLEYSQNYSITSGSFCNYYRDEIDDVNDNASDGKSFKYETKIVEKHQKYHHNHHQIQMDLNHRDQNDHHITM